MLLHLLDIYSLAALCWTELQALITNLAMLDVVIVHHALTAKLAWIRSVGTNLQ